MVALKQATTLVKAGEFNSSLEEAVKKFRDKLEPVTVGLGNTVKFAIFKESAEPYFLMIAQQKDKIINEYGYNVSMNITSYSDDKNEQLYRDFISDTGMSLDITPPSILTAGMGMWNMCFSIFEKNPKKAMVILKGI